MRSGSAARREARVPVWTPWPHIGRGSGEITVGRVCLDIYFRWSRFGEWFRKPRFIVSPPEPERSDWHPGAAYRAFTFAFGPVHFLLRRWAR